MDEGSKFLAIARSWRHLADLNSIADGRVEEFWFANEIILFLSESGHSINDHFKICWANLHLRACIYNNFFKPAIYFAVHKKSSGNMTATRKAIRMTKTKTDIRNIDRPSVRDSYIDHFSSYFRIITTSRPLKFEWGIFYDIYHIAIHLLLTCLMLGTCNSHSLKRRGS